MLAKSVLITEQDDQLGLVNACHCRNRCVLKCEGVAIDKTVLQQSNCLSVQRGFTGDIQEGKGSPFLQRATPAAPNQPTGGPGDRC
jgi:hypothetical protein